jgi:hypothetical protein
VWGHFGEQSQAAQEGLGLVVKLVNGGEESGGLSAHVAAVMAVHEAVDGIGEIPPETPQLARLLALLQGHRGSLALVLRHGHTLLGLVEQNMRVLVGSLGYGGQLFQS